MLFQPHLYSRTRHLAHEFGDALSAADAVCVTEIYQAREEPVDGVSGKLVLDALRPGLRAGWAPTVEEGVRIVGSWARTGDIVLTLGAGDVDRAGRQLLEAACDRDRGGRPARRLDDDRHRRPGPRVRTADVRRRAGGGAQRGPPRTISLVATVGLGSNLLAADAGVDALVLRLAGSLAEVVADGGVLRAGGGATNAVCLHHARAAGSAGSSSPARSPARRAAASG